MDSISPRWVDLQTAEGRAAAKLCASQCLDCVKSIGNFFRLFVGKMKSAGPTSGPAVASSCASTCLDGRWCCHCCGDRGHVREEDGTIENLSWMCGVCIQRLTVCLKDHGRQPIAGKSSFRCKPFPNSAVVSGVPG